MRGLTGALIVILALGGCSVVSNTPTEEKTPTGMTPSQAMKSLYPDAADALQAAMPGKDLSEPSESDDNCGGLDVLDSKNASKIIRQSTVDIRGGTSDKYSTMGLVNQATALLQTRGWKIEPGQKIPPGHPDGVTKSATKPGVAGGVDISATSFRLTSGKSIPILTASVVTGCLPNPNWHKS